MAGTYFLTPLHARETPRRCLPSPNAGSCSKISFCKAEWPFAVISVVSGRESEDTHPRPCPCRGLINGARTIRLWAADDLPVPHSVAATRPVCATQGVVSTTSLPSLLLSGPCMGAVNSLNVDMYKDRPMASVEPLRQISLPMHRFFMQEERL
jgi:hypothetical protein